MDHLETAKQCLSRIEEPFLEDGDYASLATAHAVLALIDIIQGDRETEIEQLHNRIEDLESMLSGCREALRQRENAEANAAKTNNDLRKSYE